MQVIPLLAIALFAAPSVAPAQPLKIPAAKLLDLTYSFDEKTIYWPTARPFEWRKDAWGNSPGGFWYASASYGASEHGGTHLDSPVHFAKDQAASDEIPVARLIAPVYVIDVSAACAKDPDYRASAADVLKFEQAYGRIPEDSIAVVRTGWGRFWPDKKRYLGSDVPGDAAHLHFPGLARDAAELLVKRKVAGAGIDTASLDHGPSKDFIAHRILNGAGIYGLENIANLERLPPTGATVIALPMKIKGGTGGPVRIVAILP